MTLSAFPHKNYYFNTGLEALQELKRFRTTDLNAFHMVNLTQWSLKEVISSLWMENPGSRKLIIISNTQLLPLAKYYKIKNNNVLSICEESESLKVLGDFCSGRDIGKRDFYYKKPHLTENEFISLRCALNGVSAREQAKKLGVSTKTAFAFRYTLAKKLQVKKLSHLLAPVIRNFQNHDLRYSVLYKRKIYSSV